MPQTKIQSKHLQRAINPKIAGIDLLFLYTVLLLNVIYLCVKSEVTNLITPKMVGTELWFLYTALLNNVTYLGMKSEVTSFNNFEVMPRTKIHSKNLQRAIT